MDGWITVEPGWSEYCPLTPDIKYSGGFSLGETLVPTYAICGYCLIQYGRYRFEYILGELFLFNRFISVVQLLKYNDK